MAKTKIKMATTTPAAKPDPVDVMEMEIPPDTVDLTYELGRWIGEENQTQQIDSWEHYLLIDFVFVLRHRGWIRQFFWDLICYEYSALRFGKEELLSPETVKQMADASLRNFNAKQSQTAA
jgi:hypothetical protein